ncbi:MAG: LamG-like jellyroll fold domain-containing protein [Candidatus Pacearchaeota archaeon]
MDNKKGVSGVIVAVLMLLVVIAAVGIFWAVTMTFIKSTKDEVSLGLKTVDFSIDKENVYYEPDGSGTLKIKVVRGRGSGDFDGVRFTFEDSDGETKSVTKKKELGEMESYVFNINPVEIEDISFVKITARAMAEDSNGKEKYSEISDFVLTGKSFVKDDSLILYLPLDGDAIDASFGDNDGIVSGATSVSGGIVGNAYEFQDDANIVSIDSIAFGNNADLNMGTGSFTISFWLKNFDFTTNHFVFSKGEAWTANVHGYDIRGGNGKIIARINDGTLGEGVKASFNPGSSFNNNSWNHFSLTVDRTNNIMAWFVNNVKYNVTDISGVSGNLDNVRGFMIGCYDSFIAPVTVCDDFTIDTNMTIDEVRIYKRLLSPEEINIIYNSANS